MSVYPETWRGKPNREVRFGLIADVSPWDGASQHNRSEVMAEAVANGHLLASSWAMREALTELLAKIDEIRAEHQELQAHLLEAIEPTHRAFVNRDCDRAFMVLSNMASAERKARAALAASRGEAKS